MTIQQFDKAFDIRKKIDLMEIRLKELENLGYAHVQKFMESVAPLYSKDILPSPVLAGIKGIVVGSHELMVSDLKIFLRVEIDKLTKELEAL